MVKALLISAVAIVMFCAKADTWADPETGAEWTYTIASDKATITGLPTITSSDVIIPSTLGDYPVTSIGDRAFYDCDSLTSVTIPDSVTSIGSSAFYNCDSLASVTIGESVTSIGDCAFESCWSLTSILMPDSVISIGDRAFYWCDSLTSVTIPASVISIGDGAFNACDLLKTIAVDSDNNNYKSVNGLLLSKDGKVLITCPGAKTQVTIPDSVTTIEDYAFYWCTSLTSVRIGNGVTSIGECAFESCWSLTSISIPDSVTTIGCRAFYWCDSLKSVRIGNGVTSIGDRAFSWCDLLTSVTIPNSVTSIGRSAFSYCDLIASVTIGDGVESIGEYAFIGCESLTSVTIGKRVMNIGECAFYNCDSLTSVTIPDSVTSIGVNAFECCDSLQTIIVENGNNNYKSINGLLLSKDGNSLIACPGAKIGVTVPDSVTSIQNEAFSHCAFLTSLIISDNVTNIGDCAFSGCSSLTSVTISDSVTGIGEFAFKGCIGLIKVSLPIVLKEQVEAGSVFEGCSDDLEIVWREHVEWEYTVTDGKVTITGVPSAISGEVIIPSKIDGYPVVGLCEGLFNGCEGLTRVTISDSVTHIESGFLPDASISLFEGCTNLEYVILPERFEGLLDCEGVTVIYNDYDFSLGGAANWVNDDEEAPDSSNGSLRSGKIGVNENSWIEMIVPGPGRLTYRWKASSEYYEDTSLNVYRISDYGYLAVDGKALGFLDENYITNGISIGGHTSWQDIEHDIFGEGAHKIRWVFVKDENEYPETSGEDCIWVDDIKFYPLTTLSFFIGDATGVAPVEITEFSETEVVLPEYSDFKVNNHSLIGWTDGNVVYEPGSIFEMRSTNANLRAVYNANTISAPVIVSSSVTNGGILDAPSALITMSCDDGADIYYTLDGSTPTVKSIKYKGTFEAFRLGEVTIKAIALRDNYFDSDITTFTYTRKSHTLSDSINISGMSVKSTGTSPWFRVLGDESYDGVEAIRSGAIGAGEASTVEMTVYGNGTISFWWKVSSHEDFSSGKSDHVAFFVDDVEVASISGEKDWAKVTYTITGLKSHTLKWVYKKNGDAYASGEDCAWLDQVSFERDLIPSINPDWGYVVSELGEKKNEVAIVFTNHTEKAMLWTVPVNLENVQFLVVGGGGGGGASTEDALGGGGGGGGCVVTGILKKVTLNSSILIKVGSGTKGGTYTAGKTDKVGAAEGSTVGKNASYFLINGTTNVIAYCGGREMGWRSSSSNTSGGYGGSNAGSRNKTSNLDYPNGRPAYVNNANMLCYKSLQNGGGASYGDGPAAAGGGGGATQKGSNSYQNGDGRNGGNGGEGLASDITGTRVVYGSGGGGGTTRSCKTYWADSTYINESIPGQGGEGAGNGGSYGGTQYKDTMNPGKNALANQGGGGGGAGNKANGGDGGSGIVVLRYTIPDYLLLEAFPVVTNDSEVAAALAGTVDAKLVENITDAEIYAAFREWALNLEGVTPEEVKASPNAWLSYALNTDKLIIAAPKEGDVVIDTFEIAATEGAFEFTVKIDGIAVGDSALEANLKKVFDVEGAETLASGGAGFSSDNVEVNVVAPENGNVKFTVTPKMGNGEKPDSFFFRVKMK